MCILVQIISAGAMIALAILAYLQMCKFNKQIILNEEYVRLIRQELGANIFYQRIKNGKIVIYNTGKEMIYNIKIQIGDNSEPYMIPFSPGEYIFVNIPDEIIPLSRIADCEDKYKYLFITYSSRFDKDKKKSIDWQSEKISNFNSKNLKYAGDITLSNKEV